MGPWDPEADAAGATMKAQQVLVFVNGRLEIAGYVNRQAT
jgi:hypothetical protein